jgi:tetratricopeptide (TPR) repeat protein
MIYSYLCLNRFDEARAMAEESIAKKLDNGPVHGHLFALAFLKKDQAGMNKELAWGKGTENEPFLLAGKVGAESSWGQMRLAQNSLREAETASLRNGMKEFAAVLKTQSAKRLAAYGDCVAAKASTETALAEVPDGENRRVAALALAQCGDSAAAKRLIDAEVRAFPQDTVLRGILVPLVEALGSIHTGDAQAALAVLEPARRFELGGQTANAPYWILYVRGTAYLKSKHPDRAAPEFQKILDFRGRQATSELIPLAQLQLARAYAMQNDSAKARTAYQDFLATWKDADPDIPILKEAKSEYAKLQ